MKNVVISIVISVVMITAMCFSIDYLNKVTEILGRLNDDIEQSINDEDWEQAYKTSLEFKDKWKDYSKKIKLYSNHQEIDTIEMELRKLDQYIKEMTKDESLASLNVLKFLLNHLSELEKIRFQNIF